MCAPRQGNSGTLFSQSGNYDNAGNVTSLSTTQAAVPGQSGSGGSETQNFCYDEQNRLVWAGNSGTQPAAGNGTCGSGSLASGLNGASYSNSYVYTHLGQLWQGPLAGGSTQEQYLYCNSQPHELSGLYAVGSTCSNKTGQGYSSSYDAFGNVTGRTFSGTTATLSYDNLNHFTEWNAGSTNQEWYLYDAAGNRVLRRFTNGSGTTMIVYAFGLEEHNYSGAGAHQNDTYYYSLGGRLLGALDGNGTTFYLTDTLGSILASFNNAAGGASVKGNQVFGPYGTGRYYKGNINTLKGFTGQYNDGSGLDYFNARYYDPVAGVFLSADSKQGNLQGMNPYAYVGGNPETHSDPTGLRPISECPTGGCNAPVDMGALSAAIKLWACGYGCSSNSSSTTQGPGGSDPLMQLQGARIAYIGLLGFVDYYVLHNPANVVADVLSLGVALNAPVPDLAAFPYFAGRLNSNSGGRIYGMLQQYIGDELLKGVLKFVRGGFEFVSIIYYVVDLFQTSDIKQKVEDAFSALAFTASLFRKTISDILNVNEESVAQVAVLLGGISVAMQLPDWLASAGQYIRDNLSGDKRNRRSAGGGPPWFPPTIPPFPNPNLNDGGQGPLGPEVGPEPVI